MQFVSLNIFPAAAFKIYLYAMSMDSTVTRHPKRASSCVRACWKHSPNTGKIGDPKPSLVWVESFPAQRGRRTVHEETRCWAGISWRGKESGWEEEAESHLINLKRYGMRCAEGIKAEAEARCPLLSVSALLLVDQRVVGTPLRPPRARPRWFLQIAG